MSNDFADRFGLRVPQPRRLFQEIPRKVKGQILILMRNIQEEVEIDVNILALWHGELFTIPEIRRQHRMATIGQVDQLETILLGQSPWWVLWVSLEELVNELGASDDEDERVLGRYIQDELNEHFKDLGIGYEFRRNKRRGYQLVRVGSEQVERSIKEATSLLADPKFKGPASAWAKAADLLKPSGPPDYPQAALQSVLAVEGFCRLVEQDEKALLSDIITRWRKERKVKPLIAELFQKLYAFRGDELAHGPTQPPNITFEEAELVLGVAANLIVYAARIHGIQTK